MNRKLIRSALLAAAVGGLTLTPAAAHPPTYGERHGRDADCTRYAVLVRHRGHWDVYRTYDDRDDARRAERFLERRGYDAKVERVRGR